MTTRCPKLIVVHDLVNAICFPTKRKALSRIGSICKYRSGFYERGLFYVCDRASRRTLHSDFTLAVAQNDESISGEVRSETQS